MVQESLFSDIQERWAEIREFPRYFISDWGRVLNDLTGKYLRPTRNSKGVVMVGLMSGTVQRKRSLPLLVANAFLPPARDGFDTPINLDGDRENNHYENLMWRPLWFARKYSVQFFDNHSTYNDPIEDVETGELYKNSMHASVCNGVLDIEIYLSMLNDTKVWPTGQIFRPPVR